MATPAQRSFFASWLGGAGSTLGVTTPAVRSIFAFWLGGAGAVVGVPVEPPPTEGGGIGRGEKPRPGVRVREPKKGVRLREWQLRQEWRRQEEEERQKALKPRRRPKPVLAESIEVAFTAAEAGIIPEATGWSLAQEIQDEDDLILAIFLADAY